MKKKMKKKIQETGKKCNRNARKFVRVDHAVRMMTDTN